MAIKNERKSLLWLHDNDCERPYTLACDELTTGLREREFNNIIFQQKKENWENLWLFGSRDNQERKFERKNQ